MADHLSPRQHRRTGFTFAAFLKKCATVSLAGFLAHTVSAQYTISGQVVDGVNHEPLPGALLQAQGEAALTGQDGGFSLALDSLPAQVSVTHLGYVTLRMYLTEAGQELILPMEVASTHLQEVVVSASQRYESVKNTSAGIGIVTRDMMRRDDQLHIAPALNRVPGVYMHAATLSTSRITIRGVGARSLFGTSKIRAYYDQIPLTSGAGETTLEDLDMSLIERIEVIKGPNSSIYGAGLGGVIHLKPTLASYGHTTLSSALTLASWHTLRAVQSFNHSSANGSISILHSLVDSEGYRENSRYHRESVGAVGRFNVGRNAYLSVLGNYVDLKSFIPSSIDRTTYESTPEAAAFTWRAAEGFEAYDKALLGLSYHQDLGENLVNTTSLFVSYRDAYEPRPFNILREGTVGTGVRNLTRYTSATAGIPWSVSGGFELFRDTYRWSTYQNLYQDDGNGGVLGPPISDNEEVRSYYNLFLQADLSLSDRWTLVIGGNYNETDYRLQDYFTPDSVDISGRHGFDPVFSPRAGVVFHQSDRFHHYLNVSHGFSPPSLEETLNPDGLLNKDIQPETGWNLEVGSRGTLLSGRLHYDLAVYRMLIDNLLVSRRVAEDAYIGINAGRTSHLGVELSLSWHQQVSDRYRFTYFANGSVTRYRFDTFVDGERDFSGNQLTGVPGETFNAGVDLRQLADRGFYGSVNARYAGRIPINDANTAFSEAYLVLRSRVGYRLSLGPFVLDGFAGVNNLADTHYAAMLQVNATGFDGAEPRYYYPGQPRNYYGGLSVAYRLD